MNDILVTSTIVETLGRNGALEVKSLFKQVIFDKPGTGLVVEGVNFLGAAMAL